MNGLDKIIAQILDDAKQESLAIREKAAGEAETTLAAAGEKVKKLEEEQAKSAAQREKSYEERLRSSAALKKRQAILAAKQAIIEEMLAAAYKELLAKPDEAYFAWMEQLLSRFVTDRAGEIYVSKRDLERMPDDFPAKIEKDGAGKGRKSGTEKRTEGDRRGLCSGVWRCRGKLFCRGVVCVAAG